MTLSTKDEIAIMRRRWPRFRVTGACCYIVTWRGELRPFRRPYEVRIVYGPRPWVGDFRITNRAPRIELISPTMVLRHPRTGELVPHVFLAHFGTFGPLLCVYDPFADEWEPGMPIADTIVPWINEWLACYELWLATGKWTGGGRHPGEGDHADEERRTKPESCVEPGQQRRRAERVAAMTGSHASRTLLELAVTCDREGATDAGVFLMSVHNAA